MARDNIVVLSEDNFEEEVLQSPLPVLIDFWAAWCGPCKMIAPLIEELADEYHDQLKIAKLDVDEYGQIAAQYGIMSIPTLLLFNGGKLAGQVIGYQSKEALEKFVGKVL